MSIKDYRRQLEEQVAQEGGRAELEAVPASRAEALGQLVRQEDPGTAHVEPLARLSDPNETAPVRLVALKLLKQLSFSSPTYPEWRPAFFDALRRALSVPELRAAAFEVLVHGRDRYAQQTLLAGLRNQGQALVPPDQALRLLSSDPHADVRDVARSVAGNPPDEETLLQAMKVLAGDPESIEGFKATLADSSQSLPIRKMAATALNNLAPELLPAPADPQLEAVPGEGPEPELEKHIGALLRTRREPVPG